MVFQESTVSLASCDIPYRVAGQGEPLLYLHPAGGVMLTAFLDALTAHRTVYIPTVPGFDGTPHVDGIASNKDIAALMADFIGRVIRGGPIDVMGVSFGGWTAMWLALLHPELVDRLVLEAPAGLRFGMDASTLTPEAERANLFAYPQKAESIRPTRERAIGNAQAFARYMAGTYVDSELAERLPDLTAPTLVLTGALDITIPPATGQFLAETLPQGRITCIDDSAHALEVDQPEQVLDAVLSFLKR